MEYLKKYADKLDYVHFKDVNETVYRQVLGERIRFFDGCGKGAMCPIGTGSLDYPAIKQALADIGYSGTSPLSRSAIRATRTPACAM